MLRLGDPGQVRGSLAVRRVTASEVTLPDIFYGVLGGNLPVFLCLLILK